MRGRAGRRELLKSLAVIAGATFWGLLRLGRAATRSVYASERQGRDGGAVDRAETFVRPPGAVAEDEFVRRCIRCHACGENCTAGCIDFVGAEGPPEARGTPYIRPRAKACVLCMECNNHCPSGALRPVDPDDPALWRSVDMGRAVIDENICFSFHGYICGICVRACPLEGVALVAGLWETPRVVAERCTGCGLCEQACVHMPQAIRVVASRRRRREEAV